MNLFAIRTSKDWVEIRSSPKSIQGIRSTITKSLPITTYTFWNGKHRTTTRKVKLSQTTWSGGKTLGVFPTWTFYKLCKLPQLGCAITIPRSKAATLIEKLRKREHKASPQGNRAGDAEPFNS